MHSLLPRAGTARAPAAAPAAPRLLPAPGTRAFDELIRRYRRAELPMVGVGSWGPAVPQIRPPLPEAPSVDQLDKDMKAVAGSRWGWVTLHQPVAGFAAVLSADGRREIERRRRVWREQIKSINAGGSFAVCMWASHGRHLQLQSTEQIAGYLDLAGDPAQPGWIDEPGHRLFRIEDAVDRGDAIWSALGAWPWSAFTDGHPPARWWEHPPAVDSLLGAIALQADGMVARLSQACALLDTLAPGSR